MIENDYTDGHYLNVCCDCKVIFSGYKRQRICEPCSEENAAWFASLTHEEKNAHMVELSKQLHEFYKEKVST